MCWYKDLHIPTQQHESANAPTVEARRIPTLDIVVTKPNLFAIMDKWRAVHRTRYIRRKTLKSSKGSDTGPGKWTIGIRKLSRPNMLGQLDRLPGGPEVI